MQSNQCFYKSKSWVCLKAAIYEVFPRVCMKCGNKNGPHHVDHIKPRSKFPKLELNIFNLQILCAECNRKKGNKNTIDYRDEDDKLSLMDFVEEKPYLKNIYKRSKKKKKKIKKRKSSKRRHIQKKTVKKQTPKIKHILSIEDQIKAIGKIL